MYWIFSHQYTVILTVLTITSPQRNREPEYSRKLAGKETEKHFRFENFKDRTACITWSCTVQNKSGAVVLVAPGQFMNIEDSFM
jgi:hypothetical protein